MATHSFPWTGLLVASVAALACGSALAAPPAPASTSPSLEVRIRPQHPRLFYTDDVVASLKQRVQTDPATAAAWEKLLAAATKILDNPNPGINALESLGLAYRMTGDRRFAAKIRDVLAREIQKPNWGEPDLLRRNPPWHAGLGTARQCFAAAVGFDCAYDALSPEERRDLARGIVALGVQPTLDDWVLGDKRIHSLDSMGHNWWSACVYSAGLALLAVADEEPRAGRWLATLNESAREWANYSGSILETKPRTFDRDGGFYESVNYASFGISEYLFFRLAWNHAIQSPAAPELPVFDRTADFFIQACYPNSSRLAMVNFGDGSLQSDGTRPIVLARACGYTHPRDLWYLNQVGSQTYREGIDRSTPFGLAYYPDSAALAGAPAVPDLPTSALFKDMGWAMLRNSWTKDSTLLAVKSGMTWNHAHADNGSFLLFHKGEYLLIDSGNCSYALPEYDAYYRQSQAHNVVLFDGQGENPEDTYHGSQFPGSVQNLIDAGDLKYVWADATGPTAQHFIRNFRHFLWVGDVILIIDDLKTYQPGSFEWLLHVDGEVKKQPGELLVQKNAASVAVRPLFPSPLPEGGLPHDFPGAMRLEEKVGLKDHDARTKVTYYAFNPPEPSRQTKFITAILLEPDPAKRPQLERLEGRGYIGVRIRQRGGSDVGGKKTTDIYLNLLADGRLRHLNSCLDIGPWQTDAYLTAFTYSGEALPSAPGQVDRYFVANGSYLRNGDAVALNSLSDVYGAWSAEGSRLKVQVDGQPVRDVALRVESRPAEVVINGRSVPVRYDPDSRQVHIRQPE